MVKSQRLPVSQTSLIVSKAYTTVVTSMLTIGELMALLLDLGC